MAKRERHGMSHLPVYAVWENMIQRCTNPKHPLFSYYGARGISVCEEWRSFTSFYEDMGQKPDRFTIERIDNDGPYCKENCRWAPWSEQARNNRSNRYVVYKGERKTVTDLAREHGYAPPTIFNRLRAGETIEEALRNGSLSL